MIKVSEYFFNTEALADMIKVREHFFSREALDDIIKVNISSTVRRLMT